MRNFALSMLAAASVAVFCGSQSASAANMLVNPSFELPAIPAGSDTPGAQGWTAFGGVFTIGVAPQSGNQALKMFGNPGGVFQEFPVTAGLSYTASSYVLNYTNDPLVGSQIAVVNIEWRDSGGNQISFISTLGATSLTPKGTTASAYNLTTTTGVAPAGSVSARAVLLTGPYGDPALGAGAGAAYFDNASFDRTAVVPEPATLGLLAGAGLLTLRRRSR